MRCLVTALITTSYLTACTGWRVQEAVPQHAAELRITLADGHRLSLRKPQVIGDSLVGFATQEHGSPSERVRVAFLAADVQRVEGRKLDAGKTALALIGLGAVIGLVVAAKNVQTTDPNH